MNLTMEHLSLAHDDLQTFMAHLETKGALLRVPVPVNRHLEISAVTTRVAPHHKTILFEQVEGSTIPIVTNLFSSQQHIALALGAQSLDDLGQNLARLIDLKALTSASALMSRAGEILGVLRSVGMGNRYARTVLCQEVVHEADVSLDVLPLPTLWSHEGGPTLTQAQVTWQDPISNERRVEMLRIQRYDAQTLVIEWPYDELHALREVDSLPVAVVLGGDPATIWSAAAPLPTAIDPFLLAGYLRGKPVPLARCISQALDVPANAEIVIEGMLHPNEHVLAGPFGLPAGTYSLPEAHPAMHITAITHRENPVMPVIVPGEASSDLGWMAKAGERMLLPVLQLALSDIVDINLGLGGPNLSMAVVSMDGRYPGNTQKVMYGLWGLGPLARTRVIVTVDSTVDLQDSTAIARAIRDNVRLPDDLVTTLGPVPFHHYAALSAGYGGRIGLDATSKHNTPNSMSKTTSAPTPKPMPSIPSDALTALLGNRWTVLGNRLLIAAPTASRTPSTDPIAQLRSAAPGFDLLVLDHDADLDDTRAILRRILGNVDWQRDILIENPGFPAHDGAHHRHAGRIVINATAKAHGSILNHRPLETLSIDDQTRALITHRWMAYGFPETITNPLEHT